MTEGVLLLTTDGAAAHRLTHPSFGLERTYVATVQGNAVAAARALRAGVELEDGWVAAGCGDRPARWPAPMGDRDQTHRRPDSRGPSRV